MASKEDADRVIERLHGLWLYGTRVSVSYAARGDTEFSKEGQQSRVKTVRDRVVSREASKESVHGVRRSIYRVEGAVDEFKREVLNSYVVAWCTGVFRGANLVAELKQVDFVGCSVMWIARAAILLMFSEENERRAVLEISDLARWFVKVEAWNPEITIATRSAWLSVVGLPMHMWSEETFNRIAQLWGQLIRVEDVTLEPQCFKRACFLIKTDCLERVEETVELVLEDWSGKIRV
ncbi:hypothetical protein V6N13_059538 [Hibiscus sabdariffa]